LNNPANVIKEQARKQKKSYWEFMNKKGLVVNAEHTELDELETYKNKCEERRNNK
jgi:hypothetical protein